MDTDLFDRTEDDVELETSNETDQVKFEDYVGEGKKYRDNDAAAKAIFEKDRFIEQLKREAAEARQAALERISMEEFLQEVRSSKTPQSPSEPGTPPVERDVKAPAVTPDDVEKMFIAREEKRKREANLAEVEKRLQEAYGRSWRQEVQKRASELEVTTQYLTKVAADSPKMFFQTLGVSAPQSAETFTPPPRGSITTPPTSKSTKNYAYYQEQRKIKGETWYFSPQTRQEIWNEIRTQGEEKFGLPK